MTEHPACFLARRISIYQREEELFVSLGTFDRCHNPTQHNDHRRAWFKLYSLKISALVITNVKALLSQSPQIYT